MNAPFLAGLMGAWTIALVAIGLFFCLAYALRRREAEYLLFGVLALALAVMTSGMALSYWATHVGTWQASSILAHTGAAIGIPVHLHFVFRYARVRLLKPVLAVYAVGAVFAALRVSGWWWVPGSEAVHTTNVFGYTVAHMTTRPLPHAMAFYAFGIATIVVAAVVMVRSYRHGQREALLALIGGVGVVVAGANDVAIAAGTGLESVYLLPHAFLVYSFGLAGTLLYRYRRAAGELEQAASTLAARTSELRRSHAELDVMETELVKQEGLAAVGELAASIAHEVRNPLAIIVNATASLRRPRLKDADREMLLGVIDEEASRLNRLVTSLLRFARPLSASRSDVTVASLAERAEEVAGERYTIEVSAPGDPMLTTVSADPGLLRLAVENLVENACQAMPDGGTIRIATSESELRGAPCIRVEVADQGPGMKPHVRQRAMDPFFTTLPSGTGLGLPIVNRIVEAHDGEMTLDSKPGSGTTVGLLIPTHPLSDSEQPPSMRRPRSRRRPGANARGSGQTP